MSLHVALPSYAARGGVVVVLGGRELLDQVGVALQWGEVERGELPARERCALPDVFQQFLPARRGQQRCGRLRPHRPFRSFDGGCGRCAGGGWHPFRSEEHTSELQSLMRISYAVFCLKKTTTVNRSISSVRLDNIL